MRVRRSYSRSTSHEQPSSTDLVLSPRRVPSCVSSERHQFRSKGSCTIELRLTLRTKRWQVELDSSESDLADREPTFWILVIAVRWVHPTSNSTQFRQLTIGHATMFQGQGCHPPGVRFFGKTTPRPGKLSNRKTRPPAITRIRGSKALDWGGQFHFCLYTWTMPRFYQFESNREPVLECKFAYWSLGIRWPACTCRRFFVEVQN